MLIPFDELPVTVIPHMRGGEKEVSATMQTDKLNRIMRGTLVPGASIGLHTHDDSSEIVYVLSGTGKMIYDGAAEILKPGMCHYCPKGHSHTFLNDGDEDVIFFAVVPQQ